MMIWHTINMPNIPLIYNLIHFQFYFYFIIYFDLSPWKSARIVQFFLCFLLWLVLLMLSVFKLFCLREEFFLGLRLIIF